MFRTQYNLILQASVCVSEECTLRGEVADLLAPVIQTMALQQQQQLMPASLGPGHAQAVARAGRNVENFYILPDEGFIMKRR